jgi:hypothetical protein
VDVKTLSSLRVSSLDWHLMRFPLLKTTLIDEDGATKCEVTKFK